ncbi:MAG TPA: P-loop NTPase fold protein [Polyangiaceae bacterium]|nr:P-loop NTPase fold protein [Polyangiaceae bacterium]
MASNRAGSALGLVLCGVLTLSGVASAVAPGASPAEVSPPEQLKPRPADGKPRETEPPAPAASLQPILRVKLPGNVAADSQVAVRGNLVVVAESADAKSKINGGVRVLELSDGPPREVLTAATPEGYTAAGVALVGDAVYYTLEGEKGHKVVKLGLDGAFDWVRDFERPLRSLPTVHVVGDGQALEVEVLAVSSADNLQLVRLDPETGAVREEVELPKCAAETRGRIYRLGRDESQGELVWCERAEAALGAGVSGALLFFDDDAVGSQIELLPAFKAAPRVALGRPGNADVSQWIISGPAVSASTDGLELSLRCEFGLTSEPCEALKASPWGAPASTEPFVFTLRGKNADDAWSELGLSSGGLLSYRPRDRKAGRTFQLEQREVLTASLGDLDRNGSLELVAVGGGELTAYATSLLDLPLNRHPRGDLALGGTLPTWFEPSAANHVDNAVALADHSTKNGAGGGFRLEALSLPPLPARLGAGSNRTLIDLGSLPAPLFQPALDASQKPVVPGPVGVHAVAHAAGDFWYFVEQGYVQAWDAAAKVRIHRAWLEQGQNDVPRGFDAAGGSVALVLPDRAVWCDAKAGRAALTCQTVARGEFPGPVALSPDGNSYWLAEADGKVARWFRDAPTAPMSQALGLAPGLGALRLLRAFDTVIYAGGDKSVATYSLEGKPKLQKTQAFRPDAIEHCDPRHAYALNAGRLVYAALGSDFEELQDQPALIQAIACDGSGNLVGISSRFGAFRLSSPPGWPFGWLALLLTPVAALGLCYLGYGAYKDWLKERRSEKRDAAPRSPDGAEQDVVGQVFDADAPQEKFDAGTEGQRALVKALRDFLDNEATSPPLTVGVYGEWGSGKSSVMRMLNDELQQTGRYVTVWFNAWRHHQESQLGPALLQNIVHEFRRQAGPRVRLRSLVSALISSRRTWYWAAAAVTFALPSLAGYLVSSDKRALYGLIGSIIPFWKSIVTPVVRLFSIEPADAADKSFSERIDFLQRFSEEFERVIGALPKNNYLVVFVDDLDRCPPNRVANVLESLNRLMESRLCFVVLGMDPDTVRRCVELRYEKLIAKMARDGSKRAQHFGDQFLEKLVGIAVSVPPVSSKELEAKEAKQLERQQVQQRTKPGLDLGHAVRSMLAGALRRLDQVFVTGMFVAAILTVFLVWRQDPERVQGWVEAVVNLDSQATADADATTKSGEAKTLDAAEKSNEPAPASRDALPPGREPAPAAPVVVPAVAPKSVPKTPPTTRSAAAEVLFSHVVTEMPARAASVGDVARVTQPHGESLSREYETAANINAILLFGVGIVVAFGCFLLAGALWRDIKLESRKPPTKDSPIFAANLSRVSEKFANPRQRVRYRNLARLTFHLVDEQATQQGRPDGWEPVFFELLAAHLLGGSYTPPPEQAWVRGELQRWLERVAATAAERQVQDTTAAWPGPGWRKSAPPPPTSATVPSAKVVAETSSEPERADAEG